MNSTGPVSNRPSGHVSKSEPDPMVPAGAITIGSGPLSVAEVVTVARQDAEVQLGQEAVTAMTKGRAVIDALARDDQPHYGVSTGFGALATRHIPTDKRAQLQRSVVRSHAAGSGAEVERDVIRAMMLLRISTLATGRTGVRPLVAHSYLAMLNAGITPVVYEYGSLGCSGDLAPLAHCALTLLGEGEVRDRSGRRRPAAETLRENDIVPIVLAEKEGLSLINGTDGMLGMLILALADLRELLVAADVAAAMSVEGLLGTDAAFAADLMALRPHPGQAASAANLRELLAGSPIMASHRSPGTPGTPGTSGSSGTPGTSGTAACTRVQDAYSLRCAPQVHGAARDTVDHANVVAGRELVAAVDNPVVTGDGRVESNGNFHGAPLGYVLDFLAIATADLASMSERRTDRFLDVSRNHGLPPFLADDPGVDSGMMIVQYTAAGIVNELKRLAVPASVDSIPSSAMQEDHVSMGWGAARKLRRSIDGLAQVIGIEILTAARALALRSSRLGVQPAAATAAVRDLVHSTHSGSSGGPGPDRPLAAEVASVTEQVRNGAIRVAAEQVLRHSLS